jgi:transposase InsO family protein
MLVDLGLVEQRYRAVREVLEDGASITEVAHRFGVVRQTVHAWLRRYAGSGMGGLANLSSRPARCPHQMPPETEARILELRRANPAWGPRSIVTQLRRDGGFVPGRSSVYRALVRHRLIDPQRRRRRRSDYKRWERSRAMELWQMDVVGSISLADGTQVSAVTGIDDHSRFCVVARLVVRATATPVCDALLHGLRTHGVPEAILTDNGKVFTGRFAMLKVQMRFERICHENGIRHLLTAPYSPTTTGKIERLHKTMRAEFFNRHTFASIDEAQTALDAWVEHYNNERPHQGIGDVAPIERFRLARDQEITVVDSDVVREPEVEPVAAPSGVSRWVDATGRIRVAGARYHAGMAYAGEQVQVVLGGGLVKLNYRGVLVATLVQQGRDREPVTPIRGSAEKKRSQGPRVATSGLTVTRFTDHSGRVSFAGAQYSAGSQHARTSVEVSLVGSSVQLSVDGKVVRVHPARHDPAKEHGAFSTPKGRPRKKDVA